MKIPNLIKSPRLNNLHRIFTRFRPIPGAAPGIDHLPATTAPPDADQVSIQVFDLLDSEVKMDFTNDIDTALQKPKEPGSHFRWININALHPFIINKLKLHLAIDTLIAEDILCSGQQPKAEIMENQLILITQLISLVEDNIKHEQISIIQSGRTVISIQESNQDYWQPILKRMGKPNSRFHKKGPGYLIYALLDMIVDLIFPVLEIRANQLEACEESILDNPSREDQLRLHRIRRDLLAFRRILWPLREVINNLIRDDDYDPIADIKTYLRDVYDHNIQAVELVESYREMAGSLQDLYLSAVSNRTNEIMRVITIIGSLFIPVTFLAGVYGMNFEHIPELSWKYSYGLFWLTTIGITTTLLIFFYRKGWIRRDK